MKTKYAAGLLAAIALAAGTHPLNAQPTNFLVYNFDTDEVTTTPYGTAWAQWFGGYFQSVVFDPTVDANNNTNSGSMKLTLNCTGTDQYVLADGVFPAPTYGPVSLIVFTNLSFDMRYDVSSAIRTNSTPNGVNGSTGVGSLDFGYMRVGSRNSAFQQDWIQNFAISATNGLSNPNTNWIHISVDLRQVPINFSDLSSGLISIIVGMDGQHFGNNGLVGPQIMWFDNFQYAGFIAPPPPPTMSILKTKPALRMFGGNGVFGRSQLSLVDVNDGWITGANYPVSYSFTLMGDANKPGNVDTHIQFIPLDWDTSQYEGNSSADFYAANDLWLRILSGNPTNTTCVADISWKTNLTFQNPYGVPTNVATDLTITNPVRAGTWTLTFTGPTTGTLTAPGASPVPFTLSMTSDAASNNFSGVSGSSGGTGIGIRIGNMNNNNLANGGVPDDWARISILGAGGTNFVTDFTTMTNAQIDTTIWDLGNSDGTSMQVQVPTNAPYWVTWTTPDPGLSLTTSTNINGPWVLPEFYNNFADGTTNLATESLHAGVQWNLMVPQYLPTSDGNAGGPLSRTALFRLQNPPPQ